jgi:hypothetical protein
MTLAEIEAAGSPRSTSAATPPTSSVAATSLVHNVPLLTRDGQILAWQQIPLA